MKRGLNHLEEEAQGVEAWIEARKQNVVANARAQDELGLKLEFQCNVSDVRLTTAECPYTNALPPTSLRVPIHGLFFKPTPTQANRRSSRSEQ